MKRILLILLLSHILFHAADADAERIKLELFMTDGSEYSVDVAENMKIILNPADSSFSIISPADSIAFRLDEVGRFLYVTDDDNHVADIPADVSYSFDGSRLHLSVPNAAHSGICRVFSSDGTLMQSLTAQDNGIDIDFIGYVPGAYIVSMTGFKSIKVAVK